MDEIDKDDKELDATNGEAHPIDIHVGQRLRQRRLMLNLTQEKLGNITGMSFQQVQKYERGYNRVSASRLFEFAQSLQVPVSYFFQEMPSTLLASMPGLAESEQETPDESATALPADYNNRETSELLRVYYRIEDQRKRRKVVDFIRAMIDED